MMKLFLTGSIVNKNAQNFFKKIFEKNKFKKVMFLATPRNGRVEWGKYQSSDSWIFLNSLTLKVEVLQLEDYKKKNLNKDILKNIDILWVPGGATAYTMYWIRRTGFDLILKENIEKVNYVGVSAGAILLSKSLEVSEWFVGDNERGSKYIPGLGLVDFDVYPHYEDNLYDQIKLNYKGKKLYLLKDGEEMIVEDGKLTVIGEERIITND